jgi:uncharacterized membrane protein
MLVPLPIGLLVSALGSDVGYWITGDPFWGRASLWLVGTGLLGGLAAAVAGLTDFLTIARVREHRAAWIHLIGNLAALSLAAISWLVRLADAADAVASWRHPAVRYHRRHSRVTGWYGGELSYRHRIGVIEEG